MKGKHNNTSKMDRLFENLMTMDELRAATKHQFSKCAVYHFVQRGMPHVKIKRKLWFPPEALRWIMED